VAALLAHPLSTSVGIATYTIPALGLEFCGNVCNHQIIQGKTRQGKGKLFLP
jgi:hypothetical protein